MVTVLLSGGLGNQMFQYAAAKALAKRLGADLAIDLYALNKKTATTVRSFELEVFDLNNPTIVSRIKNKLCVKARPLIQKNRGLFIGLGILTDTYAIKYHPEFEAIKGNVIMSGYFQNEKYFRMIADDIRQVFSFKKELKERNKILAQQLNQTQSVAIHIRRGDYVTDKNAITNFVTCDTEYYKKAISFISENVKNPALYIFSDDFHWVKKELDFKDTSYTFVDWNRGKDSYLDMQLMSLCKHNIIANSSFSWWGAWLNNNPEKIVLAPSKWFVDEVKNQLLDDFYPKGWIKIR